VEQEKEASGARESVGDEKS